jgi:hypothetical protein
MQTKTNAPIIADNNPERQLLSAAMHYELRSWLEWRPIAGQPLPDGTEYDGPAEYQISDVSLREDGATFGAVLTVRTPSDDAPLFGAGPGYSTTREDILLTLHVGIDDSAADLPRYSVMIAHDPESTTPVLRQDADLLNELGSNMVINAEYL